MKTEVKLSTIWIFASLNYLYCDLIGLMDREILEQFLAGSIEGIQLTQEFFLSAAILMQIPIIMVLLSRILKKKFSKWANIIAGTIMTLVQIGSLFIGSGPTMYYIFFSVFELAATISIVWIAIRWKIPKLKRG